MKLFAAALAALALVPAIAQAASPDLAKVNRQINEHNPLVNRPIAWSQEGKAGYGYDCKGFAYLKIKALAAAGVGMDHMVVLVVDNGSRITQHAVLSVDGVVMDDLSGWLGEEADYKVVERWSSDWVVGQIEGAQ